VSTCPRRFEAEAMRDGRLGDAERASFERHTAGCAACAQEVAALEDLAEALREGGASADDLHARRERTRLLAAFDRELVTPPRPSPARRVLWPAAVALLVVGLFAFWRSRPPAFELPKAPSASVVVPVNEAVWSKRPDGEREKIVLERGELLIRVHHGAGERPLLVVLPDGELEDTGTTFTVTAEHGRTVRVAVEEGSVVLRLRDREPITIRAGAEWSAPSRPPAATPPHSPTEPTAPAAATRSAPAAAAPPPSGASPPLASSDFRAAMAALDRGDNAGAAAAFASFAARHPRDARAEDAAYLRVIALQRVGDVAAMKEAARDYLVRYPTGFRSAEVGRLSP
jgi:hypothetical protein